MEDLTMGELLAQYDTTEKLYTGDVVEGVVISANPDEVMVNINYMADGLLPKSELPDQNPLDFKSGDQLSVFIMKMDDGEGNVMLSLTKAYERVVWDEFQAIYEKQTPIKIKVREVVKGGVVGHYKGAHVFVPASALSLSYVEDLSPYLGMQLDVLIIEFQKDKKKVVASHKEILKSKQAVQKADALSRINAGDALTGTVVRLADYGAFVDLGVLDGLVHVSQMSWRRVKHPSEVLAVGDVVQVIVIEVDRDKEKVSLKLAEIKENPWAHVYSNFAVESIVKGRVTRLMNFGAFVEVDDGIEGLVHISELSEDHVQRVAEVVSVGDEVEVMILEIDQENQKMSLSIKAVASLDDEAYEAFTQVEEEDSPTTMSDLFGDKLKNLKF